MSRPTEEQTKALKPGDKYTVCLRFKRHHSENLCVGADTHGNTIPHARADIEAILPREIKVGDMVRRTGWGGELWEVVAGPRPCRTRPAEYAVWREGEGFDTAPADNLEVVS